MATTIKPIAIQGNETAAQNRLTITVQVRFRSRFDEKQNTELSLSRFVDYPSSQDLSSVEEDLVREISRQLAQDIFDRTLGNW
jgi:outer membrane lipopolysaccharide assembly protein LptE/RlpB